MNVWAINKDLPIKHFLFELVHRYGENTFSLIEFPSQFQAAEIYMEGKPDLSAYVYTFAQNKGHYAVDLKYPISQDNIISEIEQLTIEQLFSILQTHFNIP